MKGIQEHVAAKCIAHPVRRKVLDLLADGPMSPHELADAMSEQLTNVSYHVRMLYKLQAIQLLDTRQRRGALEHYYRRRLIIEPLQVKSDTSHRSKKELAKRVQA